MSRGGQLLQEQETQDKSLLLVNTSFSYVYKIAIQGIFVKKSLLPQGFKDPLVWRLHDFRKKGKEPSADSQRLRHRNSPIKEGRQGNSCYIL